MKQKRREIKNKKSRKDSGHICFSVFLFFYKITSVIGFHNHILMVLSFQIMKNTLRMDEI
ncbi:hypothetical protein CUZ96_0636 [Enterococcus lactis]|uniref:Uncharacterized protein n=2 Tax=Enterococcus faecium TaxID=1352 RepID=A0AAI8LGH7_ENTFC|nr:hypothetical protein D9Z05_05105 [Enterococcus faecium]MBL5004687.1 hypothetical protein [Enterococcus lactis]MBL5010973.1 hypothetical protein [Enterococcus lactis]QPB62102.1 hypothetical protein GFB66_04950 [Enterococcus faecium]TKA98998.1 hypothetical protein E6L37_12290 [Enterococcus lactis]